MKLVILIGLLAAVVAAYARLSPTNQDNPLRLAHSPFGYVEGLGAEIRKFSVKLFAHALNMKNFACGGCFPLKLEKLDIVNLKAIQAVLHYLYGAEYDRLIKEPGDIPYYDSVYNKIGKMQIVVDMEQILNTWSKKLTELEPISWNWVKDQLESQKRIWWFFYTRFDMERHLEAERRLHHVFAPVFNQSATEKSFLRAQASYTQLLDSALHVQSASNIPPKPQLEEKIYKIIQRLYNYVFTLYHQDTDFMSSTIRKLLGGLSHRTLMIFNKYFEDDFGKIMSEIPDVTPETDDEKKEKKEIYRKLIDMRDQTLTVWTNNIRPLLDSQYKDSWDTYHYTGNLDPHMEKLSYLLSLEEMRELLRNATPIIGKNGTIGSSSYN